MSFFMGAMLLCVGGVDVASVPVWNLPAACRVMAAYGFRRQAPEVEPDE